jgi:hypothetical protein
MTPTADEPPDASEQGDTPTNIDVVSGYRESAPPVADAAAQWATFGRVEEE